MPLLPKGIEMKYCHVYLTAHVEQLETHQDVLSDIAARNWAVSKSDIKTRKRTHGPLWNSTLRHCLPADGFVPGQGVYNTLLQREEGNMAKNNQEKMRLSFDLLDKISLHHVIRLWWHLKKTQISIPWH